MRSYSQSGEDIIIAKYFKGKKGTLLSVGENDGHTFSNAKLLLEKGWSGYLLEPGTVCADLFTLHKDNPKAHVFNYGLGQENSRSTFYESGAHVKNGSDRGLVSSVNYSETQRWRDSGVEFTEMEIQLVSFENFWKSVGCPKFDFISIDTEGFDWEVLQQIDFKKTGTKALVIEWNGDKELQKLFRSYCKSFGLKERHSNAENLIFH